MTSEQMKQYAELYQWLRKYGNNAAIYVSSEISNILVLAQEEKLDSAIIEAIKQQKEGL